MDYAVQTRNMFSRIYITWRQIYRTTYNSTKMTSLLYNPYLFPHFLSTMDFLSLSTFPLNFKISCLSLSFLSCSYFLLLSINFKFPSSTYLTLPNANPWLKQNLNILMPPSPTNKKSQFSTNFQQFSNLDLATVRLPCIPYKNSDESPLSSQFIEKLIAHHKD